MLEKIYHYTGWAAKKLRNATEWSAKKAGWPALVLGLALSAGSSADMPPLPQVKGNLEARMSDNASCEEMCMDMCYSVCHSAYEEKRANDGAARQEKSLEEAVAEYFGKMTDNDAKVRVQESIVKRINRYDRLFARYAKLYGIPEHKNTLKAMAYVETRGRHWGIVTKKAKNGRAYTQYLNGAVSTGADGEKGMMQIMPGTARRLRINPSNLYQNMMGAAKLLSLHLEKYEGNAALALYAYNAGEHKVDSRIEEAGSEEYVVHTKIAQEKVNEYPIKVLAAKQLFDRYDEYMERGDKIIVEK